MFKCRIWEAATFDHAFSKIRYALISLKRPKSHLHVRLPVRTPFLANIIFILQVIDRYASEHEESVLKFQRYEETEDFGQAIVQPLITCILTPLMGRVHKMVIFTCEVLNITQYLLPTKCDHL